LTTYQIVCDGPGPHIPPSGAIGTLDRATAPKVGEFRCAGANCVPAPQTPQQVASAVQDDATAQLLAGATALRNDLAARAAALNTAAATLTTALNGTNLPAGATAAQCRTAILAIGTYLTANKTAVTAVGSDLDQTIKGLANFIARLQGSSATY
jgi:hypothetical protein